VRPLFSFLNNPTRKDQPMKYDEILIEVDEETGAIKMRTDAISMPNHTTADGLVKQIGKLMGGELTYEKRTDTKHQHSHGEHTHTHSHDGEHDHNHS
jgi:hypothetical protein